MLFTSQNVKAFELKIDKVDIKIIPINQSKNWTYRELVTGKLIKKIPSLLVFKRQDAEYIVTAIKDQYLTFYSNKNEKLNATYASGAYFIKYTHRW